MKKQWAFTLIELLIVVGIISILAMMATPNFLEAQTRAKVSRVKSDMRSLALALESYAVDNNKYPTRHHDLLDSETQTMQRSPNSILAVVKHFLPHYDRKAKELNVLSTPIAYISSIPVDIFLEKSCQPGENYIDYMDTKQSRAFALYSRWYLWGGSQLNYFAKAQAVHWLLLSVGPDRCINAFADGEPGRYPKQPEIYANYSYVVYDPTRGTVSKGNIFRLSTTADPIVIASFINPSDNPG